MKKLLHRLMICNTACVAASKETRVVFAVTRITALAFFVSVMLTWPLYLIHHRIFAPSPIIPVLADVPEFVNWALLVAQSILLVVLMAAPRRRWAAVGAFVILAFWVLQDLMRLQPYSYLYGFTLLLAAMHRPGKFDGVRALRLLIIGVYFWAGFHKINASFVFDVYPWFIAPFYKFGAVPTNLDRVVLAFGIITPLFEMMIGLLLVFRRARRVGTVMAGIMLAAVMLCLGPFGHNQNMIVWPWNLQLFAVEYLLFARAPAVAEMPVRRRKDGLWLAAMALFIFAPGLALLGLWPDYTAFRLYSGNVGSAAIAFGPDEVLTQLPNNLASLVDEDRMLALGDWTNAEFRTVIYPGNFVFLTGAAGLCPYLRTPWDATVRLALAPPFYDVKPRRIVLPLCVHLAQTEWKK